ncbi:MAG: hypothetical protein ICV87_07350, partial [Gemmatimonadetes bacterium]|nr:hypothetical protein [Gemmatimonadota bacterium]
MTEGTDERDGPEGIPEEYRGWFSRRRRLLVWLMLACFAAALAWPFLAVPRFRHVLRAVPRISTRSQADVRVAG